MKESPGYFIMQEFYVSTAPDFMAVDEAMLQVSLSADGRYSINASFRLVKIDLYLFYNTKSCL